MHLIWIQHLNILAFSLLIFVGSFSNEEKQAPMILNTVYTCLLNPHICHRSPYYSYCLFGQLPPCSHIFPILPLAWPLGMPHLCGFLSFSMLLLRHTIASIPPHLTQTPSCCFLSLVYTAASAQGRERSSVLFDTLTIWVPNKDM